MNKKIYNNLNTENLIKTDSFKELTLEQKAELLKNSQWFNQFNENQKEEIFEGLEDNLDISNYANPEFDLYQMEQIKEGLKANLDVLIYAKTEFDWKQME